MAGHHHRRAPAREDRLPGWLRAVLGVLVVATAVAMALSWPHGPGRSTAQGSTFVHGVVTASRPTGCGSSRCTDVTVRLSDGPDAGTDTSLVFPPGRGVDPELAVGERVRLERNAVAGGPAVYAFDDVQRGRALLGFAAVFAVLVVLVARWRGLAALAGLGVTFVVVVRYLLPGLLAGTSPTLLAMTAAGAIVLVAVPLAHGFGITSAIAVVGTVLGAGLGAGFASLAVAVVHLTGLSGDEVPTLAALGSPTTIDGLVLCGAIIGSIGVLNDVTVTQASAVVEIGAAAPGLSRPSLVAAGMRVGRDHIASTVYTLALAYAGSALPVLLLLTSSGRSGVDAFTSDAVAGEIVRSLAGGVGLVLAVPVTTALAALCVRRDRAAQT